jgi:hypothetical protein
MAAFAAMTRMGRAYLFFDVAGPKRIGMNGERGGLLRD